MSGSRSQPSQARSPRPHRDAPGSAPAAYRPDRRRVEHRESGQRSQLVSESGQVSAGARGRQRALDLGQLGLPDVRPRSDGSGLPFCRSGWSGSSCPSGSNGATGTLCCDESSASERETRPGALYPRHTDGRDTSRCQSQSSGRTYSRSSWLTNRCGFASASAATAWPNEMTRWSR